MCMLNKTKVKRYALDISEMTHRPFQRVSQKFLDRMEGHLRKVIASEIHRHRSAKTLT